MHQSWSQKHEWFVRSKALEVLIAQALGSRKKSLSWLKLKNCTYFLSWQLPRFLRYLRYTVKFKCVFVSMLSIVHSWWDNHLLPHPADRLFAGKYTAEYLMSVSRTFDTRNDVMLCNQCLAAKVHYTSPEGARAKATKVVKLNIALLKDDRQTIPSQG